MDKRFSAYRWLLKYLEIFVMRSLANPMLSRKLVENSAKSNNGVEGRGESKKQMTVCNELYRGSRLALIRKDADLLNGVLLHERRHCL